MLAWCCPCIAVGNIAESLGEDKTLCTLGALFGILCVPAVYAAIRVLLRNKLREQKGIRVSHIVLVLPQLTITMYNIGQFGGGYLASPVLYSLHTHSRG